MTQETINQRLNFLIETLGLSIRAFSAALGVSDTNTRNYLTKGTKPNSDYLESVLRHFNRINPTWLLLGEGEPFKEGSAPNQNQTNISGKKNNVAVTGGNGKTIQNNYNLADCEKERDSLRAERDSLLMQVELLNGQLQMQKTIIEGKDQMLDLLKGGFNRPN